jgi:hypothetical protein
VTYDLNTPGVARLWHYGPDWSAGFQVTRSFLTDVITSRSNKEQRRALRDVPRLALAYRAVVQDDDGQAANHWLRAAQNRPAVVPDFTRYKLSTGPSSAGASVLTIASPPAWIAAGQLLVLCRADEHEVVEVASVAGSTVNLEDALVNAWPSGSVVRPGIFGLLGGRLQSQRFHRSAAEIGVTLAAYPGGEPPEDEGSADVTFNGYEVFTAEPDWSGAPALDYLWPVEQIDFGIGRTAQFRPVERAEQLVEAQFSGLTAAEAAEIEQHFLRMKGRRGAFYRPSGEKDMTLNADVSGATFVAAGSDLADDFGAVDFAENPQAIEIVQTNGTRVHRLVTDIAASGGNSAVTVSSSVTLAVATTARISWMPLVRFAADDLTTDWRTPLAANIRTTFQTIRDDLAALS